MLKYSRGKQDQLDHESKVEEEAYEAPEAKEEEDEVPVEIGDLAVRVGLSARIRIDIVIKISFFVPRCQQHRSYSSDLSTPITSSLIAETF